VPGGISNRDLAVRITFLAQGIADNARFLKGDPYGETAPQMARLIHRDVTELLGLYERLEELFRSSGGEAPD
jgi:hypothetical protein